MKSFIQLTAFVTIFLLVGTFQCQRPGPAKKYDTLLNDYLAIWNTGQIENLEKIIQPDFELRMTPKYEAEKGIEAFRKSVEFWRKAYPDFKVTVVERIFSENAVAARWIITGTNTGEGWHPATGKRIEVPGMSILHFENNKIKDEWIAGNNGYWLSQLGYKLVAPWE